MAHFAELNGSNIVLRVCVVSNDTPTDIGPLGSNDKHVDGEIWCTNFFGGTWKQTSYNTAGGVHTLGGTPFRKNHASIGYTYDESRDAFIAPQPYPSWTINESTCHWEAPVAYPDDGKLYLWNETILNWKVVE